MKTKQLPEGWKEVELGDIFEFQQKSIIKAGEGLKKGKYKFFTSSDKQTKFINSYNLDGEFLIFATGGHAGIHYCNEKFATSTDCFIVKIDHKILTKYVYYYLFGKIQLLEEGFKGAGLKHISKKYIQDIKLFYPEDKETQKQIVKILEKVEELKNLRKQSDNLTKDYLKSVFVDMFLKKNFEMKRLGEIFKIKTGGTPSRKNKKFWKNGNIPWIKTTEVKNNQIVKAEEFITNEGLKKTNGGLFEKESILIAMYGQGKTRGRVGILKIKSTTNQACAAILPSKEHSPDYVFNCLKMLYNDLRDLGRGGNQPNLNLNLIKEFKVPIPPLPLQEKFASIVKQVEKLKEYQEQSNQEINNLFNALMQKAFRGGLV